MSAPVIKIAREAKRTISHLSVLVAFCGLESRTKLVAKCLADYYNDDLGLSWPSIARMAAYASCTPNTVRSQLIKLQGMGVIAKVEVADRPAHLRRIKSHTWSINASALPAGQISLIDDLDDDSDIPACAETLTQRPAAAAPAAPAPIITALDLSWPELLDSIDTPAIVYADGYTTPAILAPEGAIWAFEGCSLTAPEPKELLTLEEKNAPKPNTAPDHQPEASPRRASPAADHQDAPPGTTPQTWAAWQAVRRSKGRDALPTDADLAALRTAAHAHYGQRPDALELALANCVEFGWLRFDGAWLSGKRNAATGQPSAAAAADLTPEAKYVAAQAARYGLGIPAVPSDGENNRKAREAAFAAFAAVRTKVSAARGAAS